MKSVSALVMQNRGSMRMVLAAMPSAMFCLPLEPPAPQSGRLQKRQRFAVAARQTARGGFDRPA